MRQVADFYGGPVFEAGAFKHPVEVIQTTTPQFLGEITVGLCRPRALLFKFLGDAVGLHSRLLMVRRRSSSAHLFVTLSGDFYSCCSVRFEAFVPSDVQYVL